MEANKNSWPVLNYGALKDTLETVQLWTQIVGKIRMANTPWINHSWHAAFYLSGRGFTTGPIYAQDGRAFEMEFDLLDDLLRINTADGEARRVKLEVQSVAAFYEATMAACPAASPPSSSTPSTRN